MMQSDLKETLDELLISLQQYLKRSLPHMTLLADKFYQKNDQQPWQELSQFTEALEWIFQVYESIENAQVQQIYYSNWNQIKTNITILIGHMNEMEEAMLSKNLSLMGDLLRYEMVPILTEVRDLVSSTIDNEVIRHDIN